MNFSRSGERHLAPGKVFKECSLCPEMVVILAGQFAMGSPPTEPKPYAKAESPQRVVKIGRRFAVGRFELKFEEWDACVAAGGCNHRPSSHPERRLGYPVVDVGWHDARAYVEWLSKKKAMEKEASTDRAMIAPDPSSVSAELNALFSRRLALVIAASTVEDGRDPAVGFEEVEEAKARFVDEVGVGEDLLDRRWR